MATLGWRGTCGIAGVSSIAAAALSLALVKDPRTAAAAAPAGTTAVEKKETTRSDAERDDDADEESLLTAVAEIVSNPVVAWLFAASALRFMAGFGIGVWAAPFFRGEFPDDQAAFAFSNAIVVAAGGFLSSLAGGRIADALSRGGGDGASDDGGGDDAMLMPPLFSAGDPGARAWFLALSCAASVPAWAAVVTAGSFSGAMGLLFVEYLVAECWFGPA